MSQKINNAYVLEQLSSNNQHKAHKSINKGLPNKSFVSVMQEIESNDIAFSKHARARLQTRGIELSKHEVNKVSHALDSAANKGVNEAIIVMGEKLLIASVKNRTIITAANQNDIEEKIITKIDGAIFI